jgi:hypothetical protein
MQSVALNISLSLSLNVPIETLPPALYVSEEQARVYTDYLMGLVAALHILVLVAIVAVLALRLKVMLLVIDALNALTILYILSGLGLYNSTLLIQEASRGLQPFIYPFGELFPNDSTNFYDFNYRANFFSSSIVQTLALLICLVFSLAKAGNRSPDDENIWHYYRVGFTFAFAYDFMLSAISIFFWSSFHSYEAIYCGMVSVMVLIWLIGETVAYYNSV